MRKEIIEFLSKNSDIKYIFTDFFDTIVHRTVAPSHVPKLWSEKVIQKFGLPLTIDDLYDIREESTKYLVELFVTNSGEFPYRRLISEIYRRLKLSNLQGSIANLNEFIAFSEQAESASEISVQFLNDKTVKTLKHLKGKGYKIYSVSDFYTSAALIKQLILAHNLEDLFDDVFVSSERASSKHVGNLYASIMNHLKIKPNQIIMIGDDYKSDFVNAKKAGIKAFYIPNKEYRITEKKSIFKFNTKRYKHIIKHFYKSDFVNAKKAGIKAFYIPNKEYRITEKKINL